MPHCRKRQPSTTTHTQVVAVLLTSPPIRGYPYPQWPSIATPRPSMPGLCFVCPVRVAGDCYIYNNIVGLRDVVPQGSAHTYDGPVCGPRKRLDRAQWHTGLSTVQVNCALVKSFGLRHHPSGYRPVRLFHGHPGGVPGDGSFDCWKPHML